MFYSALLGKPVDHSISPALFEMLTRDLPDGYAHIKIDTKNEQVLGDYIKYLNVLGFAGINITIPYKVSAIKFADELDDSVKKVGALNTFVFKDGKAIGYNTDAIGAMDAIELKLRKVEPRDNVLIIGAGGAARAIISEVYKRSQNITIVNIDLDQAQQVSSDLSTGERKIRILPLNNNNLRNCIAGADFVINATPVGMFPNGNEEIINTKVYDKIGDLNGKYFFDAIFNPYKTRFLTEAEKMGALTCSGLYMMIFQAVAALKLWVGSDYSNLNADKVCADLRKHLHD